MPKNEPEAVNRMMLKLGTMVKDKVTGRKGMLTCLNIRFDGTTQYGFQPHGLNKETLLPHDVIWMEGPRFEDITWTPMPELPWKALGTQAEDTATGFEGTVVDIFLMMSGCLHVGIQPKGSNPKTGAMPKGYDFDIRRVKGPAFKVFTEAQREADQREKPSPVSIPGHTHNLMDR